MFRRLQFTFPEGAIFKSCTDQKLSILQVKMDATKTRFSKEFSQHHWQKSFDGDSFACQSRFDAYTHPHKQKWQLCTLKRDILHTNLRKWEASTPCDQGDDVVYDVYNKSMWIIVLGPRPQCPPSAQPTLYCLTFRNQKSARFVKTL